jgi:hypothetical protein
MGTRCGGFIRPAYKLGISSGWPDPGLKAGNPDIVRQHGQCKAVFLRKEEVSEAQFGRAIWF